MIIDNKGYSAISADFRNYYGNTNDAVLGLYAPSEMYIATLLG